MCSFILQWVTHWSHARPAHYNEVFILRSYRWCRVISCYNSYTKNCVTWRDVLRCLSFHSDTCGENIGNIYLLNRNFKDIYLHVILKTKRNTLQYSHVSLQVYGWKKANAGSCHLQQNKSTIISTLLDIRYNTDRTVYLPPLHHAQDDRHGFQGAESCATAPPPSRYSDQIK